MKELANMSIDDLRKVLTQLQDESAKLKLRLALVCELIEDVSDRLSELDGQSVS